MWVVLQPLVLSEQVRAHQAPAQHSHVPPERSEPGLSLALEKFPLSHHGVLGHPLVQLGASPEQQLMSDLPELSQEGKKS